MYSVLWEPWSERDNKVLIAGIHPSNRHICMSAVLVPLAAKFHE